MAFLKTEATLDQQQDLLSIAGDLVSIAPKDFAENFQSTLHILARRLQ
ncbi:MAG: hypothetical protein HHJ17_15515 [Rhodoferax sp.]|nr:hypothetical protein [Rhodoferax sp.]